jgi:hypothetical protein
MLGAGHGVRSAILNHALGAQGSYCCLVHSELAQNFIGMFP